ncbi:MAG TPA: hypothetical protein VFQ87_20225 [Bradyrhizobium sp.]|nr:hypothetical protein [Bradyrhizobium sp.]
MRNDAASIAATGDTRTPVFVTALEWTALAFCLAASLCLLGRVLLRCRAGFDFTDEGFYLNWISNPAPFHASVTQFGFVYHPLYRLVGGDIALLRQCNVMISFLLAFGLIIGLLRSICGVPVSVFRQAGFAATAFVIASGSLAFFSLWLPSPSYNSLVFQSLMLAAIAMLSAGRELSRESLMGWISIGIAGGILFLAKPTSALALGCAMTACLAIAGKFSFRGMLISALVAVLFLIAAAFAIDGSLAGFVRRITDGLDLGRPFTDGRPIRSIFRWDTLVIGDDYLRFLVYIGIAVFAAAVLAFGTTGLARSIAALIAVVAAVLGIATVLRIGSPDISYQPLQPLQFVTVSSGIVLAALMFAAGPFRRRSRELFALVVFFAVLPHVYAFGTGNNYWNAAVHAGMFWLLPGVIASAALAADAAAWRKLLPAAAASVLVSTGILDASMENPYRQPRPLRLQASVAEIGRDKSRLFLDADAAAYLRKLHRLADENGFTAGTPMVDLSGVSPGSLYAIGARSPGAAWLIGGYPGSTDFAAAALNLETCDAIAKAWILTEPGSKDTMPPDMLRRFGIEITRDYLDAGSIDSRRAFAPQTFRHRLLKPARSAEAARLACEHARGANPPE